MDDFKEMDSCAKFDWAFRDLLSDIMIHGCGETGTIWDPATAMTYLVEHIFELVEIHVGQKAEAVHILKYILDKNMQDADDSTSGKEAICSP